MIIAQGENHLAKACGAESANTLTPNKITEKVKARKGVGKFRSPLYSTQITIGTRSNLSKAILPTAAKIRPADESIHFRHDDRDEVSFALDSGILPEQFLSFIGQNSSFRRWVYEKAANVRY